MGQSESSCYSNPAAGACIPVSAKVQGSNRDRSGHCALLSSPDNPIASSLQLDIKNPIFTILRYIQATIMAAGYCWYYAGLLAMLLVFVVLAMVICRYTFYQRGSYYTSEARDLDTEDGIVLKEDPGIHDTSDQGRRRHPILLPLKVSSSCSREFFLGTVGLGLLTGGLDLDRLSDPSLPTVGSALKSPVSPVDGLWILTGIWDGLRFRCRDILNNASPCRRGSRGGRLRRPRAGPGESGRPGSRFAAWPSPPPRHSASSCQPTAKATTWPGGLEGDGETEKEKNRKGKRERERYPKANLFAFPRREGDQQPDALEVNDAQKGTQPE
ncbi:hypothetical protein P4O66_004440 [Electrophorus voltai]|uniref:Uncharacterized protein n=1 Tax=Electrophorus voltai TaxID=2609070 RepID=A0AAD9E2M4_9TELE|nr:hypothetical protein P4O66_004440 [Electrophorus voltai]